MTSTSRAGLLPKRHQRSTRRGRPARAALCPRFRLFGVTTLPVAPSRRLPPFASGRAAERSRPSPPHAGPKMQRQSQSCDTEPVGHGHPKRGMESDQGQRQARRGRRERQDGEVGEQESVTKLVFSSPVTVRSGLSVTAHGAVRTNWTAAARLPRRPGGLGRHPAAERRTVSQRAEKALGFALLGARSRSTRSRSRPSCVSGACRPTTRCSRLAGPRRDSAKASPAASRSSTPRRRPPSGRSGTRCGAVTSRCPTCWAAGVLALSPGTEAHPGVVRGAAVPASRVAACERVPRSQAPRAWGKAAAGLAACLALAPSGAGNFGSYGLGYGATVWRGSGLFTQLVALHLLLPGLGVVARAPALDGGRRRPIRLAAPGADVAVAHRLRVRGVRQRRRARRDGAPRRALAAGRTARDRGGSSAAAARLVRRAARPGGGHDQPQPVGAAVEVGLVRGAGDPPRVEHLRPPARRQGARRCSRFSSSPARPPRCSPGASRSPAACWR